MTTKEIDKIVNDYFLMTKKFKAQGANFRPDYVNLITDRMLELFPNHGVIMALKFKTRLQTELNWNN
jgi:hypothetical protein